MPNVDFSQLRAFLFCRRVVDSPGGETLEHIHTTRFSRSFPAKFDDLVLYASFEYLEPQPLHVEILVNEPSGAVTAMYRDRVEADEDRVVHFRLNASRFDFRMPGLHRFALYVDGLLVGTTALEIRRASKPGLA